MAAVSGKNKLKVNLSSAQISSCTDELIQQMKKVYDSVGLLNNLDVSYDNTLKVSIDYARLQWPARPSVIQAFLFLKSINSNIIVLVGITQFCYKSNVAQVLLQPCS